MTNFITVHSNRGGTGKTIISVNLAAGLASLGTNTCLLDLDLRAPSISTIFGLARPKRWLNDFLNGDCRIEETLVDISDRFRTKGKFMIVLSNPAPDAIRDILGRDRRWQMAALRRMLSTKTEWVREDVEYVIFDASPGIQYSSANAVVSSDIVLAVTTMDMLDIIGTRRIADELYRAFERKVFAIVNKVIPQFEFPPSQEERSKLSERLGKMLNLPILALIPCYCDILRASRIDIYTLERRDHPFAHAIFDIAEGLRKALSAEMQVATA